MGYKPSDDEIMKAAMGDLDDGTNYPSRPQRPPMTPPQPEPRIIDRQGNGFAPDNPNRSIVVPQHQRQNPPQFQGGFNNVAPPPVSPQNKKPNNKGWIAALVAVIVVALIGVGIYAMIGNNHNIYESTTSAAPLSEEEQIEAEIAEKEDVCSEFNKIETKYLNNGYVPEDQVESLLNEEYKYADSLVKSGKADYCELNEGDCVLVKLHNNSTVIFSPKIEGYDVGSGSGRIITAQPALAENNGKTPDEAAKKIVKSYDYHFDDKDNYDNERLDIKALLGFKSSSIIIWHGHGNHSKKLHSMMFLSCDYKTAYKKYRNDFKNDLICANEKKDSIYITYKFFKKYFSKGELKNSLIYLGTCCSMKDDILAKTLVENAGASIVLGNSNVIHTEYNLNMIGAVFNGMCKDYDVKKALGYAKKQNGESDYGIVGIIYNAQVKYYPEKNGNYKLKKSASQTTTKPTTKPENAFVKNLCSSNWVLMEVYPGDSSLSYSFKNNGKTITATSTCDDVEGKVYNNKYKCKIIDSNTIRYNDNNDMEPGYCEFHKTKSPNIVRFFERSEVDYQGIIIKDKNINNYASEKFTKKLNDTSWYSKYFGKKCDCQNILFSDNGTSAEMFWPGGSTFLSVGTSTDNIVGMYENDSDDESFLKIYLEDVGSDKYVNAYIFDDGKFIEEKWEKIE